jgi:hypothetical protein
MKVNYLLQDVPDEYTCTSCGKTNVKLWRPYQSQPSHLLCATCAGRDQGKDVSTIDETGKRIDEGAGRTDQIGWYVPAVPDEEGTGYWGYTSVPAAGVAWWRRLPNQ